MALQFPLFTSITTALKEENTSEILTEKQKLTILDAIKTFDRETLELVYALIKSFDVTSKNPTVVGLPFGGKQLKTGPKFDLDNLPAILQHILKKFVEMELDRTKNDF